MTPAHTMTVEQALRAAAKEFVADSPPPLFIEDEELERMMQTNMTQGSSLWERLEFFGLPLVEDEDYYDEVIVALPIVTLDTPPKVV